MEQQAHQSLHEVCQDKNNKNEYGLPAKFIKQRQKASIITENEGLVE